MEDPVCFVGCRVVGSRLSRGESSAEHNELGGTCLLEPGHVLELRDRLFGRCQGSRGKGTVGSQNADPGSK